MSDKPMKPLQLVPSRELYFTGCLFLILSAVNAGMALAAQSLLLAASTGLYAMVALLFMLLTRFPRVSVTREGILIQINAKSVPVLKAWDEFQCIYPIRAGLTYEGVGLLFAARPLTKEEQFAAARVCQKRPFRSAPLHDGHVWIGTKGIDPQLKSLLPDTVRIMPETACVTVNRRFTKII